MKILLVISCVLAAAYGALPANYQSLKGIEKQSLLWTEVNSNTSPNPAPSGLAALNLLNPLFLAKAFTHVSDEMPAGGFLLPPKPKLIHQDGAVAKATLVIFPNSTYTGIFKAGTRWPLIIRASNAVKGNDSFIPGFAIKVLLDGQPSVNIFSMYGLNGQGNNTNFFANNFTTIIPKPEGIKLEILSRVFKNGLLALPGPTENKPENENNLSVYEHASVGEKPGSVKAPYGLVLTPNPQVGWQADGTDFRVKLAEVPEGLLYTVSAHGKEPNAAPQVIGEIRTTSKFVASVYGDQKLYFQHPSKRWRAN